MCNNCNKPKCSCKSVSYCTSKCEGRSVDLECLEYTGATKTCTGIEKYDNGNDIVDKLDTKLCEVQAAQGKVLVDDNGTCTKSLWDLLQPGANIAFSITGTGCNRKIRVDSVTGGTVQDINVKISSNDTTSGYLNSKVLTGSYLSKSIQSPSSNEKLLLDVSIPSLLSADTGNSIVQGSDDGLFLNALSKQEADFNDTWQDIVLLTGNFTTVTLLSSTLQGRITYNGELQFRGYIEVSAPFQRYISSNAGWRYTFDIVNLTNNFTFNNPYFTLAGGENREVATGYRLDTPANTTPAFTQHYGYNVDWVTNRLNLTVYGAYEANTNKTVRISMEGKSLHLKT